ncbi:MAG TPA: isocitrate lyase/phosphoenolpyruvate mutase family protein [Blastocatellia bacterium]|nr:isocitrate lyase/phosphoenolpyruvate mutase family protein [Blastocatellia bacterium]
MDLRAQRLKADRLRELHLDPDILVLANVWDVVSARLFEAMGFPVIATSSAGVAAVLGYPDGQQISLGEMADSVKRIATSVSVPVTADMEAGYGEDEDSAVITVTHTIRAGAVGLNLEDGTRDPARPLIDLDVQIRRIYAALHAAHDQGVPIVINARTDAYWKGQGDETARITETISRGNAYLEAGADCIFVPGATQPRVIEFLCREIKGPLNILAVKGTPTIDQLRQLGVKRVSIGSGIARAALGYARHCADELLSKGTYSSIVDVAISGDDVKKLLNRAARQS